MKEWSKHEVDNLIAELSDSNRVVLICEKHNFVAGSKMPPAAGCSGCMTAFWQHTLAKTPPHERREKIERLIELVKKLNWAFEHGHFEGFKLFQRPEFKIEKDAYN